MPAYSRRRFVGTAAKAATSISLAGTLASLLASPDVQGRVADLLVAHLPELCGGPLAIGPDVVAAFVARLKTPGLHSDSPATFHSLATRGDAADLAAYLVEEFMVASNYFEFQAGDATTLHILPV